MTTPGLSSPPPQDSLRRGLRAALSRWPIYVMLAVLIFSLDCVTGQHIQFPITFVLPVTLAAWFHRRRWALALAVLLPVGRIAIAVFLDQPSPLRYILINALIRICVLIVIGYLVSSARQTSELAREVKTLRGLLPICSFCKKIRDERQQWQSLEAYVSRRSEASFSHGLCPECAEKHYGEYLDEAEDG